MGKRKTSIPGPQLEQSKRKRRDKQSLSVTESVNSVEEKSGNHTSDIENNNKKKKGNVISKNKMEPVVVENIGTSRQTEIGVEGKDKEYVSPVDNASQSVKGRTAKHLQKNKTTETAFTNDSVDVKDHTSEGSKTSKGKEKHESLALYRSTHEDTSITLQMARGGGFPKDNDADTSKNVVSLEVDSKSNVGRAQLGKRRKKRKRKSSGTNAEACSSMQIPKVEEGLKEKDTSKMLQAGSSFTSGILPMDAEITDIELVDKNHSGRFTQLACKSDSSKDVDADTSKNVPSLEIDLKSNNPESSKLGKRKRPRKKRKNKSSDTNAKVCSQMQVPQVEDGLEEKGSVGSSRSGNLRSPVEKVDCGMEKDTFDPVEVKEGSIEKEKEKQLVSEERTVEQKNDDHSARLLSEDKMLETLPVPERSLTIYARKKLLVLDLNGLLCDVVHESKNPRNAHIKVGRSSVFKRPFCDDFLKFCYRRFVVGVWSSRRKENVQGIVSFIVGDVRNLSFCWDVSRCTVTGSQTIENNNKPLVLKELKKLWNNEAADLPWKIGEYSPANTLLIDDSPYKALCNPPHTGIFPYPYDHRDQDHSLGPKGSLRMYLEGLALADNVQQYVQTHPFGKGEITASDASWEFYKRIISRVERSNNRNNK